MNNAVDSRRIFFLFHLSLSIIIQRKNHELHPSIHPSDRLCNNNCRKKSRFGQGYVDTQRERDTICNFGTMPRKIPRPVERDNTVLQANAHYWPNTPAHETGQKKSHDWWWLGQFAETGPKWTKTGSKCTERDWEGNNVQNGISIFKLNTVHLTVIFSYCKAMKIAGRSWSWKFTSINQFTNSFLSKE